MLQIGVHWSIGQAHSNVCQSSIECAKVSIAPGSSHPQRHGQSTAHNGGRWMGSHLPIMFIFMSRAYECTPHAFFSQQMKHINNKLRHILPPITVSAHILLCIPRSLHMGVPSLNKHTFLLHLDDKYTSLLDIINPICDHDVPLCWNWEVSIKLWLLKHIFNVTSILFSWLREMYFKASTMTYYLVFYQLH